MANRVKVRSDRQRVQPSKTLGSTRRGPSVRPLVRAALSVPLDDRPPGAHGRAPDHPRLAARGARAGRDESWNAGYDAAMTAIIRAVVERRIRTRVFSRNDA